MNREGARRGDWHFRQASILRFSSRLPSMPRDFQRPFVLPAGATEVVLIRHGSAVQPGSSESGDLIDGKHDPPLTELGRRQALALADRLGSTRAAALFVTPLRRTHETAQPLAERLGVEPVVLPELREVYLGDWDGHFNQHLSSKDSVTRSVFAAERWDVIPNAERMEDFSARVSCGMDLLVEAAGPDATTLAVVHGGVIAEACRQVTGSRAFAFLNADNASLTRLMRLRSGRWSLIGFNDTAHLAPVHAS
jgi:probable phosphoglycerate mutase